MVFCTECSKENLQTSKFCQQCGASLAQAAPTPPPSPKPGMVCPKCGKDLVLSQPDGSPLLDGYVHMECMSCGDKVRYKVITNAPVSVGNVQQPHFAKKLFGHYLPMAILIISISLGMANMKGWISLPHISLPGSGTSGGNIVGSWVAGDTTLTFNSNGTYTQTVRGMIFDTGTYTASGGIFTMVSRGGNTTTGSYRVSGNTLTGFSDSSGRLATYTRLSP